MSSFLGKLRSNNDAKSSATAAASKKDPNAPQPTSIERMLENAGPLRNDGSDKFFGIENFGNTCYCNSVLQCLFYTPPFREHVLSYPQRSTTESVATAAATAIPKPPYRLQNGVLTRPGQLPPAKPVITTATQPGQKPEDKESAEYRKKLALYHGPVINMSYQNYNSYEMQESMYTSLKDIFEAVVATDNRHGVVSPYRLLDVLKRENEAFRGAMHQDAHEFLNILLNSIIDGIEAYEKRKEEDGQGSTHGMNGNTMKSPEAAVSWPSVLPTTMINPRTRWLREMFEGTSTSETRCLTCETVSHRDEPFLDLSVDLEQHSSVTACLNRYSEEEMLCERNKFHCDNCGGLQEAEKRMKIKRLPQILALHLKRFKYTEDLARLQKLHHKVVYPFYLRLFNTTDDADDPDRLYELYAVIIHIGGGAYHGHYVSVIKVPERGWLLFDDELVEPVDKSYVKNFFGNGTGLATAYVLFYRQTTEQAMNYELKMEGRPKTSADHGPEAHVRSANLADLHQVRSASPPLTPLETKDFPGLNHTISLSQPYTNGHLDGPRSPLAHPSSPTSSKKDRAKEEKDRKAAEKEREKTEKEREKNDRLKKAEDEKTNGHADHSVKDSTSTLSSLSGKDLFRRSKSLRFSSLGRKDKTMPNSSATIDETTPSGVDAGDDEHLIGKDKEKEKKNRFSIRKKSFGMLS